jgi:hypothetical protein
MFNEPMERLPKAGELASLGVQPPVPRRGYAAPPLVPVRHRRAGVPVVRMARRAGRGRGL